MIYRQLKAKNTNNLIDKSWEHYNLIRKLFGKYVYICVKKMKKNQ